MQEKGRDNIDRPVCVSVYSSQNEYNVYISLFQMMRDENSWPALWTEGQAREYKNRHS